jgi:alpha-galactosidase
VLLNYTNPMAMLCGALQRSPFIKVTGLCHSVQGTAHMLADWIGAPYDEIDYSCAGINHQAWYLEYKWNGKDAYPLIHKAVSERPEIYNEESCETYVPAPRLLPNDRARAQIGILRLVTQTHD